MRSVFCSAVIIGLLSCGFANAGSLSGTYVGKTTDGAIMVQLVEGERGSLSGRHVQVRLLPSGALEQVNASVAGAADNQTIVLTIKPAEPLAGSYMASGSIDGSALRLTGGGHGIGFSLQLAKTDESEFQRLVTLLKFRSEQIVAEKVRSGFLALVRSANSNAEALSGKAKTIHEKLATASAEQRYKKLTQWMHAAHARQRSISGDGQAAVARSQIDVSINQAAIQAEQIHASLEAAQRSLRSEGDAFIKENAEAIQTCPAITANPSRRASSETQAACGKLLDVLNTLAAQSKALDVTFSEAERAWKEERQKQEQIVHASELASR